MSSEMEIQLPEPSNGEVGPYTLVGRARAKPGMAAALEKRLLAMVAPTRAEDGVLEYHVQRDRADDNCFVFFEAWRSLDDLKAHLAMPYVQDFLTSRMDYLEEDMSIQWLEMLSPYPKRVG